MRGNKNTRKAKGRRCDLALLYNVSPLLHSSVSKFKPFGCISAVKPRLRTAHIGVFLLHSHLCITHLMYYCITVLMTHFLDETWRWPWAWPCVWNLSPAHMATNRLRFHRNHIYLITNLFMAAIKRLLLLLTRGGLQLSLAFAAQLVRRLLLFFFLHCTDKILGSEQQVRVFWWWTVTWLCAPTSKEPLWGRFLQFETRQQKRRWSLNFWQDGENENASHNSSPRCFLLQRPGKSPSSNIVTAGLYLRWRSVP